MDQANIIKSFDPEKLHIVPFGGCGEFGMNLASYFYGGCHIVVDCGVLFPDANKVGVDAIVPHVDPWFEQTKGVDAYFITHGHEDHVGGLPLVYKKWPAPIYATAWTYEIIKAKFVQEGFSEPPPVTVVKPGDQVTVSDFAIEWIHVNHSIPNTCALYIHTPAGRVFHTGDFKYDKKPVGEEPIDEKRLKQIGKLGVDLVLADSTGARTNGFCPSESSLKPFLKKAIQQIDGKVILTTFASNYWRLQTILEIARELKYKIFIAGAGLDKTLQFAANLKMLPDIKGLIVTPENLKTAHPKKLIVLATGCQGEPLAALSRIVRNDHRQIKLEAGDGIIFSSRMIPGNEKSILNLVDLCYKNGVSVFTNHTHPGIHVSGHGCREDLAKLINTLKPKYYLPVHGGYTHLTGNHEVALKQGIKKDNIQILEDGLIIEFAHKKMSVIGKIDVERLFIDEGSRLPLTYGTWRQRMKIAELGSMLVSGVFDKTKNSWLVEPQLELIGLDLPDEKDAEQWFKHAKQAVSKILEAKIREGIKGDGDLMEALRIDFRKYLSSTFQKKIVVLPKVFVL
jgi:ribonuclease J